MTIRPWAVWWGNLNPTQGHEQGGDRPLIVVSSAFHLALFTESVLTVMPVTTVERPAWMHRVRIDSAPDGVTGWAITDQIRTITKNRLRRYGWTLSQDETDAMRSMMRRMLDL